eukprot:4426900-Pyramimonas_sp.AAC.1
MFPEASPGTRFPGSQDAQRQPPEAPDTPKMASGRPTTPPKRPTCASRGPSKGPQKLKVIHFLE